MVNFDDIIQPQGEPIAPDLVIKYLTSMNMAEHEAEFRTCLDMVAGEEYDGPMLRVYVISMIALLMLVGGVKWTYILKIINVLKTRSEADLQQDAVAFVNGSDLLMPSNSEQGIAVYDLGTMKKIPEPAEFQFVSTVYSVRDVWKQAVSVLVPAKK